VGGKQIEQDRVNSQYCLYQNCTINVSVPSVRAVDIGLIEASTNGAKLSARLQALLNNGLVVRKYPAIARTKPCHSFMDIRSDYVHNIKTSFVTTLLV
jgi:hypothetical protein